jgi:hypothetical protein
MRNKRLKERLHKLFERRLTFFNVEYLFISRFFITFALRNNKTMIKFIQKLIKRQKMRKEAREAAYGALCEEQKDSIFSWDRKREFLREKSRQTRQAWIMEALDGDPIKQKWLATCVEIGIIKIK